MSTFEIRSDDLRGPEVADLLREHRTAAHQNSPPGTVHALDLEALRTPDITFWTVWQQEELVGCGALRELDTQHGEIKSMKTANAHLRKGVARYLLKHMIAVARERGYRRLSLETGNHDAFATARVLYERHGFERCAAFGNYVDDGFSMCMTKQL